MYSLCYESATAILAVSFTKDVTTEANDHIVAYTSDQPVSEIYQ